MKRFTESRSYKCYYCDREIAANEGFSGTALIDGIRVHDMPQEVPTWILVCHHCDCPTFFLGEGQMPQPLPGRQVHNVPEDVEGLLLEARRSLAAKSPTAAAMALRKILMNVAVAAGAETGREWNFFRYVEYLESEGYLPPRGRGWVDQIREFGNEAAHEIHSVSPESAELALNRTISLLHFMYEMNDEEEVTPET